MAGNVSFNYITGFAGKQYPGSALGERGIAHIFIRGGQYLDGSGFNGIGDVLRERAEQLDGQRTPLDFGFDDQIFAGIVAEAEINISLGKSGVLPLGQVADRKRVVAPFYDLKARAKRSIIQGAGDLADPPPVPGWSLPFTMTGASRKPYSVWAFWIAFP